MLILSLLLCLLAANASIFTKEQLKRFSLLTLNTSCIEASSTNIAAALEDYDGWDDLSRNVVAQNLRNRTHRDRANIIFGLYEAYYNKGKYGLVEEFICESMPSADELLMSDVMGEYVEPFRHDPIAILPCLKRRFESISYRYKKTELKVLLDDPDLKNKAHVILGLLFVFGSHVRAVRWITEKIEARGLMKDLKLAYLVLLEVAHEEHQRAVEYVLNLDLSELKQLAIDHGLISTVKRNCPDIVLAFLKHVKANGGLWGEGIIEQAMEAAARCDNKPILKLMLQEEHLDCNEMLSGLGSALIEASLNGNDRMIRMIRKVRDDGLLGRSVLPRALLIVCETDSIDALKQLVKLRQLDWDVLETAVADAIKRAAKTGSNTCYQYLVTGGFIRNSMVLNAVIAVTVPLFATSNDLPMARYACETIDRQFPGRSEAIKNGYIAAIKARNIKMAKTLYNKASATCRQADLFPLLEHAVNMRYYETVKFIVGLRILNAERVRPCMVRAIQFHNQRIVAQLAVVPGLVVLCQPEFQEWYDEAVAQNWKLSLRFVPRYLRLK